MSFTSETEALEALKGFVTLCSANPSMLNSPKLKFFKDFVEKLGGKVPPGDCEMPSFGAKSEKPKPFAPEPNPSHKEEPESKVEEEVDEESEPESEVELDMEGVIEPDNEEPQEMGDSNKEPTEEEMDEASDLRGKAAAAYSEQKFEEAIDLYTKAIQLNPGNALFHAKRGQAYLKLKKPNACIRDCDRALELNCDSAAAYKFRGRANRLLGNWEAAAKDLRQACKLDYDEEADEWLKEVTPNAKKIESHRIKWDRIKLEREMKKRQERLRKAQEDLKKAQERAEKNKAKFGGGGGGGAGGMPPNFANMFGNLDEDVLEGLNDPEVAAALQDIKENPANISKYLSNPKFLNLAYKLGNASKAAGGSGFPGFGGFPGAGAGFPGADSTESDTANPGESDGIPKSKPETKKPDFSDDGLD